MLVRINISRSFTKSQWFSFSTENVRPYVNQLYARIKARAATLNGAPWVLTSPNHFISHADEIRGAAYCERKMGIHRKIHFCNCFVVDRKLVNLNTVCRKLGHDFRLDKKKHLLLHVGWTHFSFTYLKTHQFRFGNGIGFSNNWNDVDFVVQFLHAHQI